MHDVIIKEQLINGELAKPDPVIYNLQDTLSYTLTVVK